MRVDPFLGLSQGKRLPRRGFDVGRKVRYVQTYRSRGVRDVGYDQAGNGHVEVRGSFRRVQAGKKAPQSSAPYGRHVRGGKGNENGIVFSVRQGISYHYARSVRPQRADYEPSVS